jgi:hypothetical protein
MQERIFERLNRSFSSSDFKARLVPDANVAGSEGLIYWQDDDGATFGQNDAEEKVIKEWLTDFLSKKIGYPIHIIAQLQGDGKCVVWFKKEPQKVVQFKRS